MTSDQRARLLGEIVQGASSVTAAEIAGVTPAELQAEIDCNEPFRHSFYVVMQLRDVATRALRGLPEA